MRLPRWSHWLWLPLLAGGGIGVALMVKAAQKSARVTETRQRLLTTATAQPTLIDQFCAVGTAAGNQYERVPYPLIAQAAHAGDLGAGLLALFLGVANWGVDWQGHPAPADPTGTGWAGPASGSGKHLTSHWTPGAGQEPLFGIADFAVMLPVYLAWGSPPVSDFAAVLRDPHGAGATAWVRWADVLVRQPAYQRWSVQRWLSEYWAPSLAGNADYATAAVNARIRNSRSSWASALDGESLAAQVAGYVSRKRAEGGQALAERAQRQANFALRVRAVLT